MIRARIPTRGAGWVVTRYEDVLRVLKDPRFSNDQKMSANPPLFGFGGRWAPRLIKLVGRSMVCVDDPAHARLRRLVAKVFTPRSVEQMEGWIRLSSTDARCHGRGARSTSWRPSRCRYP